MFNFQKMSLTLNWKLPDVKDNQKEENNFLTGVKNNIYKMKKRSRKYMCMYLLCILGGAFFASKFW